MNTKKQKTERYQIYDKIFWIIYRVTVVEMGVLLIYSVWYEDIFNKYDMIPHWPAYVVMSLIVNTILLWIVGSKGKTESPECIVKI